MDERRRDAAGTAGDASKREASWREVAPQLDAALGELPAGYRDAVVLRHVDGLSQAEAARELGIGESAVSMRVARGLERLRERLRRRGVAVPAAILAALLGERAAASAGECSALVASIQAVCRGTAEASLGARAMLEGAMRAMFWNKVKLVAGVAAALLFAAALVPLGMGTLAGDAGGGGGQAGPAIGSTAVAAERKPAPEPDKAEVVKEANAFAFDLYAKVRADEKQAGKNLFYSPFSISSALAMTYAGAAGNTATQMAKVMHYDLKTQQLHPAFADLTDSLNARGKAGSFKLAVANRLWGQQDYAFLQNFLELNRLYYGAGFERVDFVGQTEAARLTINKWVEAQTMEKIKDLLLPGDIDNMTKMVLTNAIYFKGDWARTFDEKATRDGPFEVSAEKKVTVPMMRQSATLPYAHPDGLDVVEMPYKGDDLAMVVLVPDRKSSLDALEAKLTAENLDGWLKLLHSQRVFVSLPKFKLQCALGLKETLRAMGMTDAFVYHQADLSGMDGTRELFLFGVYHKAFVAVDEKGTEAAAATAVVGGGGGLPPPMCIADRPFVFLIRDRKTGSILFLGRVVDPTAG
jgi:serpin B